MTFSLQPNKLGFKLGEVLVGLQSGTTDNPESIEVTQHQMHVLPFFWNPTTLAYEPPTTGGAGVGQEVDVTNAVLEVRPYEVAADAAGRARVSQITTLFDGKKLGADDTLRWTTVGTGTLTFQQNKAQMSVTAGQYLIRQSPHYNPYFAGKSQIIEPTFDNFHPQEGVVKRVGYFSNNAVAPYDSNKDGFWLESDGATIRLVVQRAGTSILNLPWTSWDRYADISSYDWQNFTISMLDFLWLGGSSLRLFLKVNGRMQLVHEFSYAGTQQDVFVQSPNQPMRYEIRSSTGTGVFREICSQVSTEGSVLEQGDSLSIGNTPTAGIAADTVGTTYAVRGVKKQTAFRDFHTDIKDFGGVILASAGLADVGRFLLLLNPTLSAPLTYGNLSRIQDGAAAAGQTVTALGRVLGRLEVSGSGETAPFPDNYLASLLIDITDTPFEVVLAYQPFTTTQTVFGHITLREGG